MKNNTFSTADVKRCCEKKLDIEFRSGKEFNGWFILNGLKVARLTVPKGRKPIPPKTYQSMAAQLKISVTEFDDLLECPLGRNEYEKIIKNKIDEQA